MYMSFVSFDVFITSTVVQGLCNLSASILVRGRERRGRKREGEREREREREGGRENREVKSHFTISCVVFERAVQVF